MREEKVQRYLSLADDMVPTTTSSTPHSLLSFCPQLVLKKMLEILTVCVRRPSPLGSTLSISLPWRWSRQDATVKFPRSCESCPRPSRPVLSSFSAQSFPSLPFFQARPWRVHSLPFPWQSHSEEWEENLPGPTSTHFKESNEETPGELGASCLNLQCVIWDTGVLSTFNLTAVFQCLYYPLRLK